jgi:hypothetical protein
MRLFIIAIILLTFISCKQKQQDNNSSKADYLSKWFVTNEDSLYVEFIQYVTENSFCDHCDTNWEEKAYQKVDSNSYMGRFSLETKKYSDSIDVVYFYNKSTIPIARILLTTNYNQKLTKALDSLFNFVSTLKHFKVDKYEQPDTRSDIFRIAKGDVIVKDLRIEVTPIDALQNLKVFIHGNSKDTKITDDDKDNLKKRLFGEELLLKKIKEVNFKISDTLHSDLLTLDEARSKLK